MGAPFVKYKTEPLLHDDFSATFTTALMEKDIDPRSTPPARPAWSFR